MLKVAGDVVAVLISVTQFPSGVFVADPLAWVFGVACGKKFIDGFLCAFPPGAVLKWAFGFVVSGCT